MIPPSFRMTNGYWLRVPSKEFFTHDQVMKRLKEVKNESETRRDGSHPRER